MPKSLYRSAFSAADVSPCDVLAFHRSIFGGSVMLDGAGDGDDGADPAGDGADDGDQSGSGDGGSNELGDAGKRALSQERDARKAAEKRATAMEAQVTALIDGLKTGLGVETAGSDDPLDLIAGLRTEIDGLKHTTRVDAVARHHGITDEADLEFLRSAKDQASMDALAKRLAPTKGDDDADEQGKGKKKPGGPRPDPSQGQGSGGSGARPSSVAQVMEDRRAAREKASK